VVNVAHPAAHAALSSEEMRVVIVQALRQMLEVLRSMGARATPSVPLVVKVGGMEGMVELRRLCEHWLRHEDAFEACSKGKPRALSPTAGRRRLTTLHYKIYAAGWVGVCKATTT
jgi:hypothetical protein